MLFVGQAAARSHGGMRDLSVGSVNLFQRQQWRHARGVIRLGMCNLGAQGMCRLGGVIRGSRHNAQGCVLRDV
jgi:hypothetical protein